MSYPAYAETKLSGVEWLGDVPKDWPCLMLKRVVRFAYGESLADAIREEGPIPVYGSNGVVGSHIVANTKAPALIIGRKGSHGKVSYSASPAFAIDTAFFVDKTQTKQDLRWLFYLLSSLNLDSVSQDTGVPGLSREDAYSQCILFPPLSEQQQIAAFLDRKTAELDAVLRLKERQLELLAEKRQALISQAVTHGLDPTAPMKPSGIPWVGDVPGHWDVKRLRFLSPSIQTGKTPPTAEEQYYSSEDVAWFGPSSFSGDLYLNEPVKLIALAALKDGKAPLFPSETLMVVGIGATTGRVGMLREAGSCNQQITAIIFNHKMNPTFGGYYFKTVEAVLRGIAPAATLPILAQEAFAGFSVPCPPLPEQAAIVAYLDRETAQMDGIAQAIRTRIEKVREYRQALISAAVTGKIDVRGLA